MAITTSDYDVSPSKSESELKGYSKKNHELTISHSFFYGENTDFSLLKYCRFFVEHLFSCIIPNGTLRKCNYMTSFLIPILSALPLLQGHF